VAGGDGTLRKAFKRWRLIGGRPVLTLATGTANNISRALGADDPWQKRIARLGHLKPRPFPFVEVRYGDQIDYSFESVGFGVLAKCIELGETLPEKVDELAGDSRGFERGRRVLANLASESPAFSVELSPASASPCSALWLEVMNIPAVGPRLEIASAQKVLREKSLQLALVVPGKREALLQWLQSLDRGANPFELFDLADGDLCLKTSGEGFHVDDEFIPPPTGGPFEVVVRRAKGVVRVYQ